MTDRGCIVASDLSQEWLLPWWWDHYSMHNTLPVTFVDLGLSSEGRSWCKQKGHYVQLPYIPLHVLDKKELPQEQILAWEQEHGTHFWPSRNAWFKKPLACLQSPYKKTLWLDLDCEVRGLLDPVFELSIPASHMTIGREYTERHGEGVNSGVILFETPCLLLQSWAEEALRNSHLYVGDQDILSKFMQENPSSMGVLPPIYNWSRFQGENPNAVIMHWHGNHGKTVISHQIMKKNLEHAGLL